MHISKTSHAVLFWCAAFVDFLLSSKISVYKQTWLGGEEMYPDLNAAMGLTSDEPAWQGLTFIKDTSGGMMPPHHGKYFVGSFALLCVFACGRGACMHPHDMIRSMDSENL
jgi:hypothetical protein